MEKQKMLCLKMQRFGPVDIDKNNLHQVDDKMEIFEGAYGEFMLGIELLLLFSSDKLGADKVEYWKNVFSKTENDFIEYRKRVNQKAVEVATSILKNNEQLEDEILETTQQEKEDEGQEKFDETVKENESKKAAAESKAKNKIDDHKSKIDAILADSE